jgi:hypothetical protein
MIYAFDAEFQGHPIQGRNEVAPLQLQDLTKLQNEDDLALL